MFNQHIFFNQTNLFTSILRLQNKHKYYNSKILNFFFFSFFLNKYFSQKIKKNSFFFINNFNLNFLDSNKYLNWLITNIKKNNINLMNIFINDQNFLKMIILTLISKDTTLFINWLKFFFEILYYKNHKKFLILLKYIFFFFFKYLKNFLKFKALKFSIKGKISLGGNSKKKKQSFFFGCFSLTKKTSLVNFNKNSINTLSGMLGFYFFIFF